MRRLVNLAALATIVAGCWAAAQRPAAAPLVRQIAPPGEAVAELVREGRSQGRLVLPAQPPPPAPPERADSFFREFNDWLHRREAPTPPEPHLVMPAPPVLQPPGEPNPMLVPAGARPYQRMILREARAQWGMSAPTAMFGAQIQTESGWHPTAHSPYAAGLAQFIPATAHAMSQKYPGQLGADDPLNPQWAIRALVMYDRDLWRAVHGAAEGCDRWAFTMSAYNGGPGWIPRDRHLCEQHEGCDTSRWFGHVERYTGRSVSNAHQNREYPRRILLQYQPSYRSWGGYVQCPAR